MDMSYLTNGLSKHDYNEQSNKTSRRKTSINRHSNKANKQSGIMLYTVRDSVFLFVREPYVFLGRLLPPTAGRVGVSVLYWNLYFYLGLKQMPEGYFSSMSY